MKSLIKTIKDNKVATVAVVLVYIIFGSHTANASVIGDTVSGLIYQILANFFLILQTVAGMFIMFAGILLNYSINLTLHIKEFVDQTPAIFTTWKALRDISGIFIIFFLLYEAIQLITGLKSPKFSAMLKDVVLAGILINFSFFFAGLGIDVSNLVSVQLYNAIAPASSLNADYLSPDKIDKVAKDGGLSDIFMQSMKMPKFFDAANPTQKQDAAKGSGFIVMCLRIIFTGVVSVVIMVTAAFSFILASFMFITRFILLLFLLAFSPVWMMSFIAPELKKYSEDWVKYYKSMLLIMPIYLLLMYMSLSVLSTTKFFGNPEVQTTTTSTTQANSGLINQAFAIGDTTSTNTTWYGPLLSLAVNAVLVIFMMNIPLMGALSIGGKLTDWIPGTKALSAGNVWKKVGAFSGRNTLGRGAAAFSQTSAARYLYAKNPMIGSALNKSLGKVSSAGFGDGKNASFDAVRKAEIKDLSEIAKKSNYSEEQTKRRLDDWSQSDPGIANLRNNLNAAEAEKIRINQEIFDSTDPAEIARLQERLHTVDENITGISNEISTSTEGKRNEISKSRENAIADKMLKQPIGRKIVSKITNGRYGQGAGSQSVGTAVAKAIRKEKTPADKILEAIKEQQKNEGPGDKGGEPKKT